MELHAAHPVDFGRSLHLIFLVHLLVAKVYVLILRVGVELSEALPPLTLPLQCQLLVGALLHQQITSHFGVLRPARGCEGVHVIIALESASSPLGCCWQGNVRVGFQVFFKGLVIGGYCVGTIALSSEVQRLPLPFSQSSPRLSITSRSLLQILAHVLSFKPISPLGEGSDQRSGEFVAGVGVLDEYVWIEVDSFDLEALVPPHGNKIN